LATGAAAAGAGQRSIMADFAGVSDLVRGVRHAPHPRTVREFAEALCLSDDEARALLAVARGGDVDQVNPATCTKPRVVEQASLTAPDTDDVVRTEAVPRGVSRPRTW